MINILQCCGQSECTADGRANAITWRWSSSRKLANQRGRHAKWRASDQNRHQTRTGSRLVHCRRRRRMVARLVRLLSDYGISIGIYLARSFCCVSFLFRLCVHMMRCVIVHSLTLSLSLILCCSSLVIVFNFNRIKFHRFILYSFASTEIIVIFHYLFSYSKNE